jgi:toxin ParE1/3/4
MAARRREVRWTRIAEEDLWDIVTHIAPDRPAASLEILKEIRARTQTLPEFPDRGRIVPELDRLGTKDYRETLFPPWRIMYRVYPDRVEVLAVLDSRRNVEDLLLKRLTRTP